MGEVYKARDTRLDRSVAIKVASEGFTERFEREARAIAAFSHPHICQLYDVGPNYLVMELVDGTPLKGPLPAPKAIAYANQILQALAAAHSKGIVHRDLKPANILVTIPLLNSLLTTGIHPFHLMESGSRPTRWEAGTAEIYVRRFPVRAASGECRMWEDCGVEIAGRSVYSLKKILR